MLTKTEIDRDMVRAKQNLSDVLLTVKETATFTGESERTVRRKAASEIYEHTTGEVKGQKESYLIYLSSLPIEAQKKYHQEKSQSIFPQNFNDLLPMLNQGANHKIVNETIRPRREVIEKDKTEYDLKRKIIKALDEFVKGFKHGEKISGYELFLTLLNNGKIIGCEDSPKVIGKIKKIGTIIYEWKNKLKNSNNDFTVLLRKKRESKTKIPIEHIYTAIGFYGMQSKPKKDEAIYHFFEVASLNGMNINYSVSQFRRVFNLFIKNNPDIVSGLRNTKKETVEEFAPDIRRDNDLFIVGDIVSADGVRLPFFINGERRMLVLAVDVASGCIIGYVLSMNEDKESILLLIYRSILFLGKKFIVFQPDHGSAFMSNDVKDILKELNIELRPPAVRNAPAKYAERTIQRLNKYFRMIPTFSGNTLANKPAHFNQGEFEAKKRNKDLYSEYDITPEVANDVIVNIIDLHNNELIKSGKYKGRKRVEVLNEGRGQGVNKEELTSLMMRKLVKKPNKNGIKIGKFYYYNNAMYGRKKSYLIRYDLVYNDSIYVFDSMNGDFLFEAFRRDKVHPQAGVFGTEDQAREVYKAIQHKKGLIKHTFDNVQVFHDQIVKPCNEFLLHKIGLTKNKNPNSLTNHLDKKNLIDAEIVNEVNSNLLLKTGTDNIALESIEDKPIVVDKKNTYFYKNIIKK